MFGSGGEAKPEERKKRYLYDSISVRRTASKVSAEQAEEKYEGRVDQGTGERSKKVVPACLGDHRLKNLSRILGYRDCREKKEPVFFIGSNCATNVRKRENERKRRRASARVTARIRIRERDGWRERERERGKIERKRQKRRRVESMVRGRGQTRTPRGERAEKAEDKDVNHNM